MKPILSDVKSLLKDSLFVKEIKTDNIHDRLHFHNAYEMTLILKGRGKRIVGDNISYFSDGDLTLLGPNLPHVIQCSENKSRRHPEVHAIVIYFQPDWLKESHLNSPQLTKLRTLLNRSNRGLRIVGQTQKEIVVQIFKLQQSQGLDSIITILQMLEMISQSAENEDLASPGYSYACHPAGMHKIDEIYKFVMNNFTDTIKLDDAASIAHMTPTAFSRYFKCKTNKNFSCFVNEIRIGYACKLLMNDNLDVSQICFRSGFNNLTNFNKNFKRFTKMIPTAYKAMYKCELY